MARFFKDREYLPALLEDLRRARRKIAASVFLIDPGTESQSPLEPLFRELRRAQQRRVEVHVETSGIFSRKPSGQRLRRLAARLAIPIEWRNGTEFLHQKSVSVDEKIHWVGSHNWTPAALLENREASLRFQTGEAAVLDAKEFRTRLLRAIREAQAEITLATYEIEELAETDEDFADELVRQLIFARMKKRKVRVILDASLLQPSQAKLSKGETTFLYRGRSKAEALARWKVHVYYDTTNSLFHAKLAVIDSKQVWVGSQNINPAREGEVEKTAFIKSALLARQVKRYLAEVLRHTTRFRYDPSQFVGVRIPSRWVYRGGPIALMFQRRAVATLSLWLALLHEAERLQSSEIPWEEAWIASLSGVNLPRRFTPSVKNAHHYLQRILTQPRIFLGRQYGLVRYDVDRRKIQILNGEGKPYERPKIDYFVLPWEFWKWDWHRRLTSGERYAYFIQRCELSRSPEAPYWSGLREKDISSRYGISGQRFAKQNVRLERLNLIEVDRDIKIGDPEAPKRPNRYRINPLWSKDEELSALRRLQKEMMARDEDLKEAQRLADRLNQPHDLEVIRKFLILIERYGKPEVRKATSITARFKPYFALRHVHHTAGILRNWARGIRK